MRRPTNVRAEDPARARRPAHDPVRVPRAPPRQDRGGCPRAAGQGPRPGHGVLPDEARGGPGRATASSERGFATAAVHGDLGQAQRERALRAFRSGKVDVLVATDVAARGIDVDDVTHVINYECPTTRTPTCTASAAPAGPAATGRRGDLRGLGRHAALEAHQRHARAEPPASRRRRTPPPSTCTASCRIPPDATGRLPVGLRARAGLSAEAEEDIGETGHPGHVPAARGPTVATGPTVARAPVPALARGPARAAISTTFAAAARWLPARPPVPTAFPRTVLRPWTASRPGTLPASSSAARWAGHQPGRQPGRRLRAGRACHGSLRPSPRLAQDASRDGGPEDDAHADTAGQRAARQRATRRRSADSTSTAPARSASLPVDDLDMADEDVPVRPLVASAPITMPAAPGVPAAIFQASLVAVSTPTSLALPAGVRRTAVQCDRGTFAVA